MRRLEYSFHIERLASDFMTCFLCTSLYNHFVILWSLNVCQIVSMVLACSRTVIFMHYAQRPSKKNPLPNHFYYLHIFGNLSFVYFFHLLFAKRLESKSKNDLRAIKRNENLLIFLHSPIYWTLYCITRRALSMGICVFGQMFKSAL